MFKKVIRIFGYYTLLEEAFEIMLAMLKEDLEMFRASVDTLRHKDDAKLPFNIYEKDKEINAAQQNVRQKILTHLALSKDKNIGMALGLVSIVIDLERIGDYTKNISELAVAHPARLQGGVYEEELLKIEGVTLEKFNLLYRVFLENDVDLAREIMSGHKEITTRVDITIQDMIQGRESSLSGPSTITVALYYRYLKRISAHLTNMASSIVNPFPRIGFHANKKNS